MEGDFTTACIWLTQEFFGWGFIVIITASGQRAAINEVGANPRRPVAKCIIGQPIRWPAQPNAPLAKGNKSEWFC